MPAPTHWSGIPACFTRKGPIMVRTASTVSPSWMRSLIQDHAKLSGAHHLRPMASMMRRSLQQLNSRQPMGLMALLSIATYKNMLMFLRQ